MAPSFFTYARTVAPWRVAPSASAQLWVRESEAPRSQPASRRVYLGTDLRPLYWSRRPTSGTPRGRTWLPDATAHCGITDRLSITRARSMPIERLDFRISAANPSVINSIGASSRTTNSFALFDVFRNRPTERSRRFSLRSADCRSAWPSGRSRCVRRLCGGPLML